MVKAEFFFHLLVSLLANPPRLDGGGLRANGDIRGIQKMMRAHLTLHVYQMTLMATAEDGNYEIESERGAGHGVCSGSWCWSR